MSTTPHQTPAPPAAPEPGRSRVAEVLLTQPLRNLGVSVTVLVLGSTAAFGGLRASTNRPGVEQLALGQAVRTEPFDITVTRVAWSDALPEHSLKDGDRWLMVYATVRNVHEESAGLNLLSEAVTLTGVDGLEDDTFTYLPKEKSDDQASVNDATTISPVQPGLDYKLAFLWEQKGSVPAPTRVTVTLVGHTWRQNSLDHTYQWLDPAPIARADLAMAPTEQARRNLENGTPGAASTPEPAAPQRQAGRRQGPAPSSTGTPSAPSSGSGRSA